ncbi:MAG: 4Fe-4S binding protein [Candidatus Ranarchaeia archaeon]
MVDMQIEIAGMKFRNPMILGSGAIGTRSGEEIIKAVQAGAGGIMVEGIEPDGCDVYHPWLANVNGGLLNNPTHSIIPTDEWLEKHAPLARQAGVPLIMPLRWSREKEGEEGKRLFIDSIQRMEAAGIDAFMTASWDEHTCPEAISTFKKYTDKPVFIKTSYSRTIQWTLKDMVAAGMDGIIAIDGPSGMRINVDTGLPLMGGVKGYGMFTGRPIFPLAIYTVFRIATALREMGREDIPIIGGGGISQGADCVEMLMAGATAFSPCTGIYMGGGISTITDYMKDVEAILTRLGVNHVHDVKDKTHKFLANWSLDKVEMGQVPPTVDPMLCNRSGLCATTCPEDCIEIKDIAIIDEEKCTGCTLCVSRCPTEALQVPYIRMMPKKFHNNG